MNFGLVRVARPLAGRVSPLSGAVAVAAINMSARVTAANGIAEREAMLAMLHRRPASRSARRRSIGARGAYAGYAVSQRCRKRIEEVFGWIKAQAGFPKVK